MNTYERIKETRKLREMTQTELAIKCGYADKSMISRIENGKVDIFLSNLERIAKALNVDPAYLMGWTEDTRLEDLAEVCRELNEEGQEKVREYAELLASSGEYKKHNTDSMVGEA